MTGYLVGGPPRTFRPAQHLHGGDWSLLYHSTSGCCIGRLPPQREATA